MEFFFFFLSFFLAECWAKNIVFMEDNYWTSTGPSGDHIRETTLLKTISRTKLH